MNFTIESITGGFLHPTFTRITGQPNQKNLIEIHQNLCKNYSSVQYNLRRVNHDLLAIVIGAQDYLAQMGHTFIARINLGDYPNILDHAT